MIFNNKRMRDALSGESIMVPQGLNSEEVRQFILKNAK